jgi:penicillin amidase
LSTNWRDELLRARFIGRVGEDGAATLLPAYTSGGPLILPDGLAPPDTAPSAGAATEAGSAAASRGPLVSPALLDALSRALPTDATGLAASNNWVLNGTRTTKGRPILANDPHLGARLPSVWYLAHLSGGELDAIGATLPGLPGIVIGHNRRIAWGETNLMTDVQDFFVERVNAKQQALYMGEWQPMTARRETIRVKGAPDEVLVVRSTRHGPLVSDILPGSTEALALRWTALDAVDRTLDAFLGVNLANDWAEFTSALSRLHVPMQNFVYADVDGNIGYYAPGAIPVRAQGDGTRPVPGWSGDHEWTGHVPDDQVPRAFNPARGYVVTANNQALPDDFPHLISTNWEAGYRAARIVAMIERQERHSVDDVARMQADQQSAQAAVLTPWLSTVDTSEPRTAAAVARLKAWNGSIDAGSADAALFEAWKDALARRLFADELGPELWQEYAQLPHWIAKALHRVVADGDTTWCDDVATESRETCAAAAGAALSDAVADGERRYGTADVARWRWGQGNEVTLPHLPFDFVPFLRPFFSRTVPAGGDAVTVNPVMRIRDETIVSSYRQVIDLSDLDASRFVHTLGQSGQLLTGRYDDYLDEWRSVAHLPMRFSRAAVDAAARHRLVLQPR